MIFLTVTITIIIIIIIKPEYKKPKEENVLFYCA